jgi:CRISPR-associated protein Cas2
MYAILVYDIDESRVGKMNRFLKAYLLWVQNSVFEGEISESLLNHMIKRMKRIIKDRDSVILYTVRSQSVMTREIFGFEKGPTDNVL